MKNYNNNANKDDHSYQSKKNSRIPVSDLVLNIDTQKSTRYNPDIKECIFERDKDGYGFKITGNAPVKVQSVRKDSFAWRSGLRENDTIIEVNGNNVIDKQHKDVVQLIRQLTRVELRVESDNTQHSLSTASLSPKVTRFPNNDLLIVRPNSLPKGSAPPVLPKPRVLLQKPPNSTQRNPNDSQTRNKLMVVETDSPDNTSECSISTTSTESEPPVRILLKKTQAARISPTGSQNETPTKSNSFNVPKANKMSTPKLVVPQKKLPPDAVKNKTIPPDGAKSYNPTLSSGDIKSQISYGTLPKKKTTGYIRGRDFDDDNEDDDESDSSLTLIEMLSSTKEALSKPGLVAILLNYVKEKFEDMKIMIFFYTCKLYKSVILRRDFQTDAQRMANEILTTFLYEKSPLYLNKNVEVMAETIKNFKAGENFGSLFDPMLKSIDKILEEIVEDVRGKVKRGIQLSEDVSSFINSMNSTVNPDREMSLLHRTMCNIFNKNQKDSNLDDNTLATHVGLATMYQYFHNFKFLPGASIRARSTDSLNHIPYQTKLQTISDFFKVNTLCAPYQPIVTINKRKKSKSVNGHVLIDAACKEPEECAICEGILWGASPQGVFCTMCSNYYHTACKKKIKSQCSRKLRKSNSQLTNKEEKSAFFGRLSRKSSTNSVRSVNMSTSGENVNNIGNSFFNNSVLVPDDRSSTLMMEETVEMSKSQSEDQLNRVALNNSMYERYGSNYDFNNSSMNQVTENGFDNAVQIQELVQDETLNDPDMKMEESFDAETEISSVFPDLDQESNKKRLIVLLEFYHKTRYILMNLKRFWYCLVSKWPASQYFYFKALSLDCIDPFVNLIKSLVVTIEKCIIDKKNFHGLEDAIFEWLSENNDDRLKEWISLSSNLCCTNSLNMIKQMKQTTLRTIPELTNLLKAKFHKLVMIEELTQIRPLLISLPLIVKNIIKCLTKLEPQFDNELLVWKQVSTKMDYLCEYIDRCCIPLVDWINNGSIVRRSEKIDWPKQSNEGDKDIRDYCQDFPRTLFHFPIFDFQIAKIIAWSTNTKKNGVVVQTTYFKKGTEVLLIFYKNFIIVLQKENDHYVLKPIRPLKNLFDKQPPIIEIDDGMHITNGGQEETNFILNVITNKPDNALLLRIGLSRFEVVDSWLEYIGTKTFNLGRSISIFKNNDLRSMPDSSMQFERTMSNVSGKSKTSQESIDPALLPNNNNNNNNNIQEPVDKEPEKSVEHYLALSDTLTKASETMNSKASLCAILNISEDDYPNHLKTVMEAGIKSPDEFTALTVNLVDTLLQQSQSALTKACPRIPSSYILNVNSVIQMLRTTADVLEKWEQSPKKTEKLRPPPPVKMRSKKTLVEDIKSELEMRLKLVPKSDDNLQRETESHEQSPDTIINDKVKSIIEEIIEDSVEQIRNSQEIRDSRSYKYVPADSLLPAIDDDNCFLSEVALSPSHLHLNAPADDTVTVSRAQIVLQNRGSVSQ